MMFEDLYRAWKDAKSVADSTGARSAKSAERAAHAKLKAHPSVKKAKGRMHTSDESHGKWW